MMPIAAKRKRHFPGTDLKFLPLLITLLVRLFVIASMKGTKVFYQPISGVMEILRVFVREQRTRWSVQLKQPKGWELIPLQDLPEVLSGICSSPFLLLLRR